MKRKLISLIAASLVAIMITSTVFARSIKFSSVTFSLGTDTTSSSGLALMTASDASNDLSSSPSLIATGTLTGLGNEDVTVKLEASGFPEVTCTNYGGNQAPGQNPPKISANGEQTLFGDKSATKNGRSPFDVGTHNPVTVDAVTYGCPNENWTATIDFVFWTEATIRVLDLYTGQELASQNYTCTTTLNSVTCTPVK
jgi:hypothetical protein